MQIDSFKSHEVKSLGPHPDYERNLSKGREFITGIQKSILPGMMVKFSNPLATETGDLKYSILSISWNPPFDSKIGIHCYPVSLHQEYQKFCSELERKFSEYHKAVKEYWESKNVKVLSSPLPEISQKASDFVQDEMNWWDR